MIAFPRIRAAASPATNARSARRRSRAADLSITMALLSVACGGAAMAAGSQHASSSTGTAAQVTAAAHNRDGGDGSDAAQGRWRRPWFYCGQ